MTTRSKGKRGEDAAAMALVRNGYEILARNWRCAEGELDLVAQHRGEVVFVESSVTRMNLKSAIARVTRRPATDGNVPLKAYGAVWGDGTPIAKVEVKLDDGQWREAKLDAKHNEKYCWRFFSIDLGPVAAGKHTLVSRGVDAKGRAQPAAEDDEIALKKTYWEAYAQWPRTIEVGA